MSTNDTEVEAEYEVIQRRQGRVQLEIIVSGQKQPINHGMKVDDITSHDGTPAEAIEERVKRIATRHVDPGDNVDLPESGKTTFDPRTHDGKPKKVNLKSEENKR